MIQTFGNGETATIWEGRVSRRLPREIQDTALRKLRLIHNAKTIDDLRIPPGNRLEALRGDLTGQWSIRINDQWRICFVWQTGDAFRVSIVDYHR